MKTNFLFLFIALALEGEPPTRQQAFIASLGLSDELAAQLANEETPVADVAAAYNTARRATTIAALGDNYKNEIKDALKATIRGEMYSKNEGRLFETFDFLKVEDFAEIKKGKPEAILAKAKAHYAAQIEEIKKAANEGKTATESQLREQIEALQLENKSNKERADTVEASIPKLQRQWEDGQLIAAEKNKLLTAIDNHKYESFDEFRTMINAREFAGVTLKVVEVGDKKRIGVFDDKGAQVARSATESYYLAEYVADKSKAYLKQNNGKEKEKREKVFGGKDGNGKTAFEDWAAAE